MLKRKVLFCTSAMVVVAAGVFATGNKAKRDQPTQLWVQTGLGGCVQVASAGIDNLFSTNAAGGQQATIKTRGGSTTRLLFATNDCNPSTGTKVYFD